MITVEHLTKRYGTFTAVEDLSFEIPEGHVYGFLGPNGAGKSTTMNIMTGCLSATEGRVRINGYDILEEPHKAKRLLGYLPEQPPLYMNETPWEYLKFVGEAKGLKGRELTKQVEAVDGIVVDTDRGHYAFQAPYILLPDIAGSEITDPLIEEGYYAILPIAQGLKISDGSSGRVTELLTTSEAAFSKTDGYALSSYEKEEGDTDGPFALAVSVAADNDGQIVWFTSSHFLDEMYNAYSSGANLDLAMNTMSALIGENEAVAIRSKSLNYNYLTISDSTASFLKTMMIAVFPLAYLGVGILVVVNRRKGFGR